ncbi:MAG: DUF6485 family protein [Candidatus Omnitrophica bacterium]|nr:DUF6485 family protein [Candidatus Omnitrophota bacterium]
MPGCPNLKKNLKNCSCSYASCGRKGMCCECVDYHRRNMQIPGCFFSPAAEKTYDRSVEKFINTSKE